MMTVLLLLLVLSDASSFHVGGCSNEKRACPSLFATSRRNVLATGVSSFLLISPCVASASEVSDLAAQIKEARAQLDTVPALIEKEQWDSVRALLIKPPLSDCWAKTARPLLPKYAEALGDAGGDELAALEGKEDVVSHIRYLDMAVYNNNFNPIKSEGENGATKELIRSYYEDPKNEWKASVKAFDELIELAN